MRVDLGIRCSFLFSPSRLVDSYGNELEPMYKTWKGGRLGQRSAAQQVCGLQIRRSFIKCSILALAIDSVD